MGAPDAIPYKHISMERLTALRLCVQRKDQAAHGIGVMVIETLRENQKAESAPDEYAKLVRRGAIFTESSKRLDHFMAVVERADRDQGQMGELAMREVGVDPSKATYTIDLNNGLILRLVNGDWQPVEA